MSEADKSRRNSRKALSFPYTAHISVSVPVGEGTGVWSLPLAALPQQMGGLWQVPEAGGLSSLGRGLCLSALPGWGQEFRG